MVLTECGRINASKHWRSVEGSSPEYVTHDVLVNVGVTLDSAQPSVIGEWANSSLGKTGLLDAVIKTLLSQLQMHPDV